VLSVLAGREPGPGPYSGAGPLPSAERAR
jgi:hypothetical protein